MDVSETMRVEFPADSAYVAHIRSLVADVVTAAGFSQKFAYRTELVVDELLDQAVRSGAQGSSVQLVCEMSSTDLRLSVSEVAIAATDSACRTQGLDIVRMLSSSMEFSCNEQGESTVQVIRSLEKPLPPDREAS